MLQEDTKVADISVEFRILTLPFYRVYFEVIGEMFKLKWVKERNIFHGSH